MTANGTRHPKVLFVSPLPPHTGGMGVQGAMWLRRMRADGWTVRAVRNNIGERAVAGWPRPLRRGALGLVWIVYCLRVLVGVARSDAQND